LPGGLSTVKALHDPRGTISKLQSEIPSYSEARARHRVRQSIGQAHYSLYGLGWLKKAAVRRDHFSFLKNESDLLEKFFYALFALNRTWFSDEKRLTSRIRQFEYCPEHADRRIQSIIMHQDDNEQLAVCLANIKQLFQDMVSCAHRKYPDLDLPIDWA
jgi:hypothetical protein